MEILAAKEVQDKLTGIIDELRSRTNGPEEGDLTDIVDAITEYDGSTCQARYNRETTNGYVFDASMWTNRFVKSGSVYAEVDKTDFGNARADYVAEGHTFTSENGFCIEGTMPIYDYTPIEAYPEDETDTHHVFMGYTYNTIFEDEIYLKVPKSEFGDATASDVRKGKTFTSADGVMVEGTYEGESGGGASVASCTLVFNVDDWGNLYVAYSKSDGTAHRDILPANATTTIEGVMCGSVLVLYSSEGTYFGSTPRMTLVGSLNTANAYQVPNTSGTYELSFDRS